MAGERTEKVIEAVRALDRLEDERKRLTASLDEKIAFQRAELDRLVNNAAKSGRTGRRSEIGAKFLEVAGENPKSEIADLAAAIYGSDTPQNRHRVRAQAHNLKKAGKLRGNSGEWVVVRLNGSDSGAVMMFQ